MIAKHRSGVTLIELMIVIGIMAALTAVAVGTYFAAVGSQQGASTEIVLAKLDSKLMARWQAVIDSTSEEIRKPKYSSFVANVGDRRRAHTVLTYMRLKNEFPMTFAEAKNGVTVSAETLPSLNIFSQLPNPANVDSGQDELQSAVCLYLFLVERGIAGESPNAESLTPHVGTIKIKISGVETPFLAFLDGRGFPISFVRCAYTSELNATPYIRASTSASDPLNTPNVFGMWDTTAFWNEMINNIPAGMRTKIGMPGTYTHSQNWTPTLVSAGSNKEWGASLYGGDDDSDDNVVSFRIRAGMKGN